MEYTLKLYWIWSAIIVPAGGGALLAGIAVAAKALKPSITIIVRIIFRYKKMFSFIHDLD